MAIANFYNTIELQSPPILSYKICYENPEIAGENLQSLLKKIIKVLKNQDLLHQESAALSRFIYKWKTKLRNEKGMKALQKVNRSLLQYVAVDYLSVVETVNGMISEDHGPTRQVLEWLLVRLQGFCKLFDHIYNRCIEVGGYLQLKLKQGHYWVFSLVGMAFISRIWTLSKKLVVRGCKWYNQLISYIKILHPGMDPWLPEGYELPQNIEKWLGNPEYISGSKKRVNGKTFVNKSTPGKNMKVKKINSNGTEDLQAAPATYSQSGTIIEDVGETISRKSFEEEHVDKINIDSHMKRFKKEEKRILRFVTSRPFTGKSVKAISKKNLMRLKKQRQQPKWSSKNRTHE